MKLFYPLSISAVSLALMASGCIDDNYDLSDIDTTARISVNQLVVPVNIDQIQMKTIIDIDENDPNSHIKVVDNAYAYVQSGDFSTGSISVPEVHLNSVDASTVDLHLDVSVPALPPGIQLPDFQVAVPAKYTDYTFKAQNISDDICGLSKVTGELRADLKLTITGVESVAQSFSLTDFRLTLPEGIIVSRVEGASYESTTNTLLINTNLNGALDIVCYIQGMNIPTGAFNEATHSLEMSGHVGIEGGNITVHTRTDADTSAINGLNLKVEYKFGAMNVTSVDGTIRYSIDDVNVPDIDITDLPDILSQPSTNLILTNPCLYLSVNNPLYTCGLYAQTGFEITSYHGDNAAVYSIDNPYFTIEAQEIDNFCFSPTRPAHVDPDFTGCQHVPFSSLSKVLSGDGLPDKLKVDLINPCLPRQQVKDFALGHDYGSVRGDYKFVAPLQFESGTFITYSDVVDGWSSDDLDKITVTHLEVRLTITTDIPVGVEFTGYPLDKNGNRINGVEITGATIQANANAQDLNISVDGTIKDLDGIEFVAKASAAGNSPALSPDMHVILSNIRPCLSGYYEDEL